MIRGQSLPAIQRGKGRNRLEHITGRTVLYVVITVGAFIFSTPLLWMISTSLKSPELINRIPIVWIPPELSWANYIDPWREMPFLLFYMNTIFIAVTNTAVILITNSLVAFGFARIPFKGRTIIFFVLLATMMLPPQVTLIPTYLFWSRLHLVNTFWPIMAPEWLSAAYDVFLMRQFYMTISTDLDEAARIDGCSWFGIYRHIILPLSKPVIGVLAILNFSFNWNNFLTPLIYLNDSRLFPIALGLRLFETQMGGGDTYVRLGPLMAMTLVSIIPLMAAFFVAQRYFIQGIVITGIKG